MLNKNFLLLLIPLFHTPLLFAQTHMPVRVTKNQGDCIGAYLIRDTVFGPVLSPEGPGHKIEIKGYPPGDLYFFEQEHNTVWYKIKAPYSTTMWFDIIPLKTDDDFDFLLFKNPGPAFCSRLPKGEVLPVRTNISRVSDLRGGRTGLSPDATANFIPSGPGNPYSKAVEVKKGDEFLLVVDNPYRANEGHTIHLHFKKKKNTGYIRRKQEEASLKYHKVHIKIVDQKTGEPVSANLTLSNGEKEAKKINGVSEYVFEGEVYRSYNIRAEKKGYMFTTLQMTVFKKKDAEQIIKIQKIEAGIKVALKNIRFEGDKTAILASSKKNLNALLRFMKQNPSVKIDIQGHVNAPGQKNKKKHKLLSEARAEAVFNHLILSGIEKERLIFRGFGNSQMIYPNPISDHQSEVNRRVEVMITAH